MSDEAKVGEEAPAVKATQKVKEVVNEGVAAARERCREVATEARGKADRFSGDFRRGAGEAGEAARERYAQFSENVRDGYEKARKDADDLTESVNEYVRDNPGKSVLVAAGAGFLLGLLFRGRRDA